MSGETSTLVRWARSDVARTWTATITCTVLTLVINLVWNQITLDSALGIIVRSCILAWGLLALVYSILVHLGFRGLTGREFVRAITGGAENESGRTGGHAGFGVQMSVLALVAMVLLAFIRDVREDLVLVVLGLGMVAASWAVVALSYALHYARLDTDRGGLRFPGEGEPSWARYLYFAVSVQATFGTTDVEVVDDRARRAVLTQTLVAYLFNTVIFAVIVALLLGVR